MSQPKVATAALLGNHEEPSTVHVHQHFQAARTRTGKQIAADLSIRKEHFYTWADGQGVAYVTIAKQRVYVMADVEEAIRRAGKIAPPAPRPVQKKPPAPTMSAVDVARAAGLTVVGGSK